ncbi:hypothetical protein P4126_31345 [Pseudomonas aeruginosa]|nr:hypothetical protein [Pseudomonas aeruginosa]MDF5950241.1 hypothetical protein [Pseudomonas aeruginosa]
MLNAINYYGHNMKSIIAILLAGISINLAASPLRCRRTIRAFSLQQ